MKATDIAAEAVQRWVIQLRQWLGYDVPQRWIDSLTIEVQSAIEKAYNTGLSKGYWKRNAEIVSAAHASEKEQIAAEAGYQRCEGCGDPIVGILTTPTGLCHELCAKDKAIANEHNQSPQPAHASEQGAWPKQIQQYFKHCDVVFFLKMESELELNQRKGNWRDWNPNRDEILSELKHHVAKLLDVLETEFDVTEYAADVANLCMKAATLSQRPTPSTLQPAHASEPLGMTGVQAEFADAAAHASGQWTWQTVRDIVAASGINDADQAIADAHNAAMKEQT